MAVDTRNKRASACNMPLFVVMPLADGAVTSPDWEQATGYYSGIPAGTPVIVVVSEAERRRHRIGASVPVKRQKRKRVPQTMLQDVRYQFSIEEEDEQIMQIINMIITGNLQ